MNSDDQRRTDAEKTIASILAIARVYGGEVALLARRLGLDPGAVPRAAGAVWARTLRPQLDRLATPALAPLLRRIGDQLAVLIAEIATAAATPTATTGSTPSEPGSEVGGEPASAPSSTQPSTQPGTQPGTQSRQPTGSTERFDATTHADDSADEIMNLVREATARAQASLNEEPERTDAGSELGPDAEPNTARMVADAVGRELKAERLAERIRATRRRIEETQTRIARADAALACRRERRRRVTAQLQSMGQAIARLESKTDALLPPAEPAKLEPRGAGAIPSGPRRGPARVIEHPAARRNGRRSSES